MNNLDINLTISRLHQRDPTVIGGLFDAYGNALYGAILRIVPSRELADQVLQDTFVKAWKNGDSYDPANGQLFTWLLNIARCMAIDAIRTDRFQNYKLLDPGHDSSCHPKSDSAHQDYQPLPEDLSALEEKYRRLIDLAYFNGYSQQEISEEMQIPLGTIQTRIHHALEQLREIFYKRNFAPDL